MPNSPYKDALDTARAELATVLARKQALAVEEKAARDDQQKARRVIEAIESLIPPQHIDADRRRGPSDWDRECQESGRLNR